MLSAALLTRDSARPASGHANCHASASPRSGAGSVFASALDAIRRAAQSVCAFVRDAVRGLAQRFTERPTPSCTPTATATTASTPTTTASSVTATSATSTTSTTPAAFMNDNSTTASELALRRREFRPDTDTYTLYVQLILSAPWLRATTTTTTSSSTSSSSPSSTSTTFSSTSTPSSAATQSLPERTPHMRELQFHGDTHSPWHTSDEPLPVDDLLVALPPRPLSGASLESWRADFAASPWLQACWAANRMQQAAEYRAVAPRPQDPVTHECSCGWCPNGIAAYELCAAVTIRRTIRSFGPRASSFGSAGAAVARRVGQRSCAALSFAPPRFGRARG